jgi:hypothetical protein
MHDNDFKDLIRGARLLESDRRGPKVYETLDGRIVKLFRIKRRLSSNLWSPFALRFASNAARLTSLGLSTVQVTEVAWIPDIRRQMVIYPKLAGEPLRRFLSQANPSDIDHCMERVGKFIAAVQNRGVFFRSLHFGNILIKPDGNFALIDVLDVWIKSSALGAWRRRRNLRHLTKYKEDRELIFRHWDSFRTGYVTGASSTPGYSLPAAKLSMILDNRQARLSA